MGEKYGIVAVGYNRPDSMDRLLKALNEAEYYGDEVLLIISLDNCGNESVKMVANSFVWQHGDKIVKYQEKRLGLRNHILKCGSYMDEYDLQAVAVFEDDIYPSPAFYNFMRQAVPFYADDNRIAGIALYNHSLNAIALKPFTAMHGECDVYFLQYAMSWGQIWMRKQWRDFAGWYDQNDDISKVKNLPSRIKVWPDNSWLKYHIAYCVDKDKYFVQPYDALATCFSDSGEHTSASSSFTQVPMCMSRNKQYIFENISKTAVVYDVYFERKGIADCLNLNEDDLMVDLYGTKHKDGLRNQYMISPYKFDYAIVDKYALLMKPHELNVVKHIGGDDIYLYRCTEKENGNKSKNPKKHQLMMYYYGIILYSHICAEIVVEKLRKYRR